MAGFGAASESQLATCHPDLVRVLREAIKYFDFSVVEGFRGKAAQDAAYAKGYSQKPWPLGNHNKQPSLAADIAPYPIDWSSKSTAIERFCIMQGVVWACAQQVGIPVRLGLDWNRNLDTRDEHFRDYPHVELFQP